MTLMNSTTVADLRQTLSSYWKMQSTIGLVPTMGALHEGHLSLVRRARQENQLVVASIFVNPTQFGPSEDFARYPRTLEEDLDVLASAGADLVFMPTAEEMYPAGFASRVEVGWLATILEGARRPEHFAGVATVVTKLLNLVRPTRAYFGQKDAQQAAVIRRLVADLNLPVEIQVGETVRDADGMALSSRNRYLSPSERAAATVLYRALISARSAFQSGTVDVDLLRRAMHQIVDAEPLARLEYAECVDVATWEKPAAARPDSLLVIAASVGRTRLIDNLLLREVVGRAAIDCHHSAVPQPAAAAGNPPQWVAPSIRPQPEASN
jgi:pantoate--beta-alanine ligase